MSLSKFSNLPKHKKKLYIAIIGTLILYLVLNFGILKINPRRLILEIPFTLMYLFSFQFDQINKDVLSVVFDIVLFGGSILIWVLFFSMFVLPARTVKERRQIPALLFQSTRKGPAIFIRNGEKVARLEESDRKGKGVIVLDTASAAVLTKEGKFSRAVGPGLIFTDKKERIANTIDLRIQVRTIGPKRDDVIFFEKEDPQAADQQDKESENPKYRIKSASKNAAPIANKKEKGSKDPLADNPEAQRAREARRMQTSGLTRDGIEIVPTIKVIFKLDADPEEGHSQFGYRDESVRKAILHQAIVVINDKPVNVSWDWLPPHLAADLWREYLRKFTMNELFDIAWHADDQKNVQDTGSGLDKTGFNHIVDMINKRLTQPEVPVMNDVGKFVPNKTFESREYAILQSHGIRVRSAAVIDLQLKDEDALIERWETSWLQQARIQKANTERRHQVLKQRGEEAAQMDFAISVVGQLYREISPPLQRKPNSTETLNQLLRSTRSTIAANPNLIPYLSEERSRLEAISDWITNYRNGLDEDATH